jgi:hypothetical protein
MGGAGAAARALLSPSCRRRCAVLRCSLLVVAAIRVSPPSPCACHLTTAYFASAVCPWPRIEMTVFLLIAAAQRRLADGAVAGEQWGPVAARARVAGRRVWFVLVSLSDSSRWLRCVVGLVRCNGRRNGSADQSVRRSQPNQSDAQSFNMKRTKRTPEIKGKQTITKMIQTQANMMNVEFKWIPPRNSDRHFDITLVQFIDQTI